MFRSEQKMLDRQQAKLASELAAAVDATWTVRGVHAVQTRTGGSWTPLSSLDHATDLVRRVSGEDHTFGWALEDHRPGSPTHGCILVEGRAATAAEAVRAVSQAVYAAPARMVVNLTPHTINILGEDGVEITSIPSSGMARAAVSSEPAGTVDVDGSAIPIVRATYGELTGLPTPNGATQYVVSPLAAQAAAREGRTMDDLLLTHNPVRDSAGRVIGARGFARP